MTELILVDANNLAIRNAFANSGLCCTMEENMDKFNPDDIFDGNSVFPTGVLHGFLKSIIALRHSYPDGYMVILWDSGHDKRSNLTKEAVGKGIIKEAYKENRRKKEIPQEIQDFKKQKPVLKDMLKKTNIPQLIVNGEETDDLIASLSKKNKDGAKIVIYSTDKDFYQLLDDNVEILRSSFVSEDEVLMTKMRFVEEYGIQPRQWVDVGALCGDAGDNIFSAPGWGEKTATGAIKQFGTYQAVLEAYHSELDQYRLKFPDIPADDTRSFKKLCELQTPSGKPVYPSLWPAMPFSGVALALSEKVCKAKIQKTKLTVLMYEERVHLAYELKKMYEDLPVPELPSWSRDNKDELVEICRTYNLDEVASNCDTLCQSQVVTA